MLLLFLAFGGYCRLLAEKNQCREGAMEEERARACLKSQINCRSFALLVTVGWANVLLLAWRISIQWQFILYFLFSCTHRPIGIHFSCWPTYMRPAFWRPAKVIHWRCHHLCRPYCHCPGTMRMCSSKYCTFSILSLLTSPPHLYSLSHVFFDFVLISFRNVSLFTLEFAINDTLILFRLNDDDDDDDGGDDDWYIFLCQVYDYEQFSEKRMLT